MDKQFFIDLLKPTRKSFIKLHKSSAEVFLKGSKIGGIPYWPKDREYPLVKKQPLKLIAQINLAEMSKKINPSVVSKFLPNKGILQFFFVYGDDEYGLYKGSYVFFHPDTDIEHSLSDKIEKINLDNKNMPFKKAMAIDFSLEYELLGLADRYNRMKFEEIFDEIDLDDDEVCEVLYDSKEFINSGNKMGGYAHYTQDDPIVYESDDIIIPDDLLLLLQLDSEEDFGMTWGELGIANWIISERELRTFNFDNVRYNFDSPT